MLRTDSAGGVPGASRFFFLLRPEIHTCFTNHCVRLCILTLNFSFRRITELGKDMVPKRIFFTKGVGKHRERLTSFELALRDAGIAAQNLVRVSSIFPPNCKLLARKEGVKYLHPGEVVFAVVAENSTREPHRLLASSIGVAIPADEHLRISQRAPLVSARPKTPPVNTPKNSRPRCSPPPST